MANFWKKLNSPFSVLAPMEGVTDVVFREIISEVGKPDVLFTEFTSADALDSRGYLKTVPRLAFTEVQRPIVAQLWGTNPEKIFNATKIVNELGYDGIDINMGCPDKAVVKKGAGAALIKNPEMVSEISKAVNEAKGEMAFSLKTRIGFNEKVTEDWVAFLLNLEIDALTIHGRTAKELSKVPADWNEISKCVKLRDLIAPNTVIIGNGDVKSLSEINNKHQKYGVDGVMIGRGIFADPFLFENPKLNHPPIDHINLLIKHSALFTKHYNGKRNYAEMRRFFKIYIKAFEGAPQLISKLMECENHVEVCNVLELNKKLYQ